MRVVNLRKNIAKALHQEQVRIKQLKAYKPMDEGDWNLQKELILKSETRLQLLKELQQPIKDYYHL